MAENVVTGPFMTGYRCVVCGAHYKPDEVTYVCPHHGDDGILDVEYDYEAAKKVMNPTALAASGSLLEQGMWRYRAMLPLPLDAPVPAVLAGATPVCEAPRLAALAGVARVVVKDDGRSPTASFKDRASALAVAVTKVRGSAVVATASTGNAAAALAGMSAAMDQPCVIFVPASAPPAKIAQLLAYGATVFAVQGTYDQAFELCMDACRRMGWYNRNTGYNPFMAEGKKTAAYELCEQLGWKAPDALFVSVGDGCIIAGIHKGLRDCLALGLIDKMPRLYGIQAAGSDFLTQCAEKGEDPLTKAPINATTVADSISAGLPRDRVKAFNAVKETKGAFIRVSDDEILAAIPELARLSGVFAEPAAAAAWAGLKVAAAKKMVAAHETVAVMVTGSGLKDVAAAAKACGMIQRATIPTEPSPEGLTKALKAAGL